MKFITSKTAKNYISEIHQPREWGGLDNYEIGFVSEHMDNQNSNNGEFLNNKSSSNVNLSLENKKVKYFKT